MKAAFMGSDSVALPMLDHLYTAAPGGVVIDRVFTQPDRPSGRGMHLHQSPVKVWAQGKGLPVHQPRKCGEAEAMLLKETGIELVLVMAYGQLLPKAILEAAPMGILNLHASLLPRLRGASPIHTAVALGLPESGVSLMRIIPRIDAGPVAGSERVPIGSKETSADLHANLAEASVPLIDRSLPQLVKGRLSFEEQDESKATYCRIIEKADAHLDFAAPAELLANRVRAFQPWPGTSFPCRRTEIRILEAEVAAATAAATPGTILSAGSDGLRIACGSGILRVLRLQRPGGKPLPADAFLRGFPIDPKTRLESRPMRPLEAHKPFPYRRKRNSPAGNT